jgi:hypothetical protein
MLTFICPYIHVYFQVEPLVYPLLFWHGEAGWNWVKGKKLPFMNYLRARMLIPEPNWEYPCCGELVSFSIIIFCTYPTILTPYIE